MRLLVLYPKGRVSPTQVRAVPPLSSSACIREPSAAKTHGTPCPAPIEQEAQMLAHAAPSAASNVRVAAVEGTSDDLDEPIAAVFRVLSRIDESNAYLWWRGAVD